MRVKFLALEKNFLKGFLFGSVLCFGQINIAIGLPVTLFFLFITSPQIVIRSNSLLLFIILGFEIIWQLFIWHYFKSSELSYLFQSAAVFVILGSLLLIKCDIIYIKGMCTSISFLLFLDIIFNLTSIISGQDPLGRIPDFRVSDIMPRLGGLFGHNFFSLNVSVIGFFSGLILKNNFIVILSLLNIIINGSLRSWLLLILFGVAYLFVRYAIKFRYLIAALIGFVTIVFVATIFAAAQSETGANVLRVFAWKNSLEKIIENPIYGNHNSQDNIFFEGMSEKSVEEFGIAESQYLQLGLDFGIFAMVGYFSIIFIFLFNKYKLILTQIGAWSTNQILAMASIVIFVDTWYGSIFGSVLTTFFFGIIFLSIKNFDEL